MCVCVCARRAPGRRASYQVPSGARGEGAGGWNSSNALDFLGFWLDFLGFLWISLVFGWISLDFLGFWLDSFGFLWIS